MHWDVPRDQSATKVDDESEGEGDEERTENRAVDLTLAAVQSRTERNEQCHAARDRLG